MRVLTDGDKQMLLGLVERSESRIDRTNEMIAKLVQTTESNMDALNMVIKEYTRQLDALQSCRDELLAQNTMLIHIIENLAAPAQTTNVNIKKNE